MKEHGAGQVRHEHGGPESICIARYRLGWCHLLRRDGIRRVLRAAFANVKT